MFRVPRGRIGGGVPIVVLAGVLALATSCGGGDGSTPVGPDPSKIAITTLIPGGENASSPSWSPDGNIMAFRKNTRDTPQSGVYTFNVFVIPVAGGGRTQLSNQTDNADASSPLWSPDGRSIVFSAGRSGDSFYQTDHDLWIVPATGGVPAERGTLPADNDPLHPDDSYDAVARGWSPDGSKILFDSPTRPGNQCCEWRLFLIPPGGGYPQDLATALSGKELWGGSWSPDGTRIACSGSDTGSDNSDVYVVPVSSGTPEVLVGTPNPEGNPDWSPNGDFIVYSSLVDGKSAIWVMPTTGGSPTKLVEFPALFSSAPLWSPEGSAVVYSSFTGEVSSLWVIAASGGTPMKVVETPGQHSWYPSWSPDGEKLAFVSGSGGIAIASNLPHLGDTP